MKVSIATKKKETAHRCYKSLGSVETNIANGIKDPIAHFQKEVDELNNAKKKGKSEKYLINHQYATKVRFDNQRIILYHNKIFLPIIF